MTNSITEILNVMSGSCLPSGKLLELDDKESDGFGGGGEGGCSPPHQGLVDAVPQVKLVVADSQVVLQAEWI